MGVDIPLAGLAAKELHGPRPVMLWHGENGLVTVDKTVVDRVTFARRATPIYTIL